MKKGIALGCGLSALAVSAATQPDALGRLFFTPEERRALDILKRGIPAHQSLRVDGLVSRSAGKDIHWANGLPIDGAPPTAAAAGRRLKAGEMLIPATGERRDIVPEGSIVIHPLPESR